MRQRRLTETERAELDALNNAVTVAIETRRAWLDAKMVEVSPLQVGDDIYDLEKGVKVGVVSEIYRFWRDRDEGVRDTEVSCNYQYETRPRCFDNTSRQYGQFGTREDALERANQRAAWLSQSPAAGH